MDQDSALPDGEWVRAAPGLLTRRRGFFGVVAAAMATAALPGADSRWRRRQDPEDWTLEQFVREVTPVCKQLVADTSARGQHRYLLTLAAFAIRLGSVPVPESRQSGPGHKIGSNHGPDPFTVLHWQLEPKAVITPHAHTYGNVVTLGLTGAAIISNYETVAARDYESSQTMEVVRVQEQVLRAGDVNLVSLERHYVHGFVAGPEGATGLDITTRVLPRRKTPVLEIEGEADPAGRTFKARWNVTAD